MWEPGLGGTLTLADPSVISPNCLSSHINRPPLLSTHAPPFQDTALVLSSHSPAGSTRWGGIC